MEMVRGVSNGCCCAMDVVASLSSSALDGRIGRCSRDRCVADDDDDDDCCSLLLLLLSSVGGRTQQEIKATSRGDANKLSEISPPILCVSSLSFAAPPPAAAGRSNLAAACFR